MKQIDIKTLSKDFLLLAGLTSERDGITFSEAIVQVGNKLASTQLKTQTKSSL